MNKKQLFLILSLGLCLSACEKSLVEDSRTEVTDNYISTPAGLQDAVDGSYSYLRNFYGTELGGNLSVTGTDEYTAGADADRDYNTYTTNLSPTKGNLATVWNDFYTAINTCNAVINRAPQVEGMDAALKNTRVAEAQFLRAYYYFMLVQMFGPVPLSTTETLGVVNTATRTPVETVYNTIIDDLNSAVANLPVTTTSYGRVIKPAAEHLLAKVYLTRAGISNNQEDYSKAAALAKGVISNYSFSLLNDFSSLFSPTAAEKNSEVIFSVQYSNNVLLNGNGNQAHLYFVFSYDQLPGMQRDLANGRGFKRYKPTAYNLNTVYNQQLDGRYDKTFKRVYYCNKPGTYTINGHSVAMKLGDTAVYFPNTELTAAQIATKNYSVYPPSKVTEAIYPTLTKFLDPLRTDAASQPGVRDFILFRLGETYLIAAEALLLSGHPDEAVTFINTLRRRAAKTGATTAETNANKLAMEVSAAQLDLNFILDERMRELNGEHHRWLDLVRTKQLVNRVKLYNPSGAPNIKDYHMLRPIPQTQIDRTEGGSATFPQNDGY